MPGSHAKLSPSSSKIWMACPGMPTLTEGIESEETEFAAEGTAAHELAETCLLVGSEPQDYLGKEMYGFEVTQEMIDAVDVYVQFVRENTAEEDEVSIEERLMLTEDIWGTGDYVRYRPSDKSLFIADYKHGRGVYVDVKENSQALTYASMAAKRLGNRGVSSVTMAIVQPRCGGNPIRKWEIDVCDLVDYENEIRQAAVATKEPNAPLIPGEHCKFCPAAFFCPALHRAMEQAMQDFEDIEPTLTEEELGERMKALPMIENYVKSLKAYAFKTAMNGGQVPGHKVVQKRAVRKWRDEKEAVKFLKSYGADDVDIFNSSLRSPAQVENALGKESKDDIQDLVEKVSSGLTLAHETDDRAPVDPTDPALDFEEV